MAQSNFEENSEIEELHIEPTDVMIGDRNKSSRCYSKESNYSYREKDNRIKADSFKD